MKKPKTDLYNLPIVIQVWHISICCPWSWQSITIKPHTSWSSFFPRASLNKNTTKNQVLILPSIILSVKNFNNIIIDNEYCLTLLVWNISQLWGCLCDTLNKSSKLNANDVYLLRLGMWQAIYFHTKMGMQTVVHLEIWICTLIMSRLPQFPPTVLIRLIDLLPITCL